MAESGWPPGLPRLPIFKDWDSCQTCDRYWDHPKGGSVGQAQDHCSAMRDTRGTYNELTAGQVELLRQVAASDCRCPFYERLRPETAVDAAGWARPLRVLADGENVSMIDADTRYADAQHGRPF